MQIVNIGSVFAMSTANFLLHCTLAAVSFFLQLGAEQFILSLYIRAEVPELSPRLRRSLANPRIYNFPFFTVVRSPGEGNAH